VDTEDPSVRIYNDPFAADIVGNPDPKKIPKLDVEDTKKPTPEVPPAAGAVVAPAVTAP